MRELKEKEMRLREFMDVDAHMLALKDEIDAITVIVRQLNRRNAGAEFERAQKRLMTAQAKVALLAKPVTHTWSASDPRSPAPLARRRVTWKPAT